MTLPRVQPINPTRRREPFDDPNWLFDFKYDGFRGLFYVDRGGPRFVSRNGNLLSRFDALCELVAAELDVDDAILDGEVIAADETGRPQFYDLLRRARAPAFVAFDILWLDGIDSTLCAARRAPEAFASDFAGEVADHLRGAVRHR